jgi:hypothetical protein
MHHSDSQSRCHPAALLGYAQPLYEQNDCLNPENASSRNEHSLARAVRLENEPNFMVILKSAQQALSAADVPCSALGDGA